jgi:2-methylisocitrate lyase-like PEP mutase family enzyme
MEEQEKSVANGNPFHRTNTPGGRLRRLLSQRENIIVAPGVYDGFSARIALEVGFDCLYMVSYAPHQVC